MKRFSFLAAMAVFVFILAPAGYAQDGAEAAKAEEPAAEEKKAASDPAPDPADVDVAEKQRDAGKSIFEMLKKFTEEMEPQEQKHFFMAYNNYNLIGTVRMVQGDVSNAISKCGENNPDMKDDLESRFTSWNGAVNPILTEADANLNNMVFAQDYAKPKDIKKIFKGIDETREKANREIEKIPVTTPEACTYLLGKMDETQETMTALLRSTLVTFPQAFPHEEPSSGEENAEEETGEKDL